MTNGIGRGTAAAAGACPLCKAPPVKAEASPGADVEAGRGGRDATQWCRQTCAAFTWCRAPAATPYAR